MTKDKLYKVLDIHCHLAQINPYFVDMRNIPFKRKRIALNFYKLWAKKINVKWTYDIKAINESLIDLLLSTTNTSVVDNFVMLPMDGVYNELTGEMVKDQSIIYTSNEKVVEVCKKNTKLIAAASINPYRKDAMEELEKAVKNNVALVKWLPGLQMFSPNSEKAVNFAKECKKYGLPLLIHVGPEFSFPGNRIINEYHKIDSVFPILDTGCKVILPHVGGFSILKENKELDKLEKLVDEYPNLYFDNSGILTYHRSGRTIRVLSRQKIMDRIIYGTDFPVTAYLSPFIQRFLSKQKIINALRIAKEKNSINKDLFIKQDLEFDEKTFYRGYKVIRTMV